VLLQPGRNRTTNRAAREGRICMGAPYSAIPAWSVKSIHAMVRTPASEVISWVCYCRTQKRSISLHPDSKLDAARNRGGGHKLTPLCSIARADRQSGRAYRHDTDRPAAPKFLEIYAVPFQSEISLRPPIYADALEKAPLHDC
jgi:hypothetical protein